MNALAVTLGQGRWRDQLDVVCVFSDVVAVAGAALWAWVRLTAGFVAVRVGALAAVLAVVRVGFLAAGLAAVLTAVLAGTFAAGLCDSF